MSDAASIVAAIRSRGSDARDLRDAAHEAHHALRCNLRGPWERERIHARLMAITEGSAMLLLQEEIDARAVEWVVCRDFGQEYDADHWAMIAAMESIKGGMAAPVDFWISSIARRRDTVLVRRYADRVIAIKPKRLPHRYPTAT